MLKRAKAQPEVFFVGLDAAVENLREASRKAERGVKNALFGRLSLENAPGDLADFADAVTVLLPWGSLLRAVAAPEPALLAKLGALAKAGGSLRIVFGYGASDLLGLPPIDASRLERAYAEAGLEISARSRTANEVRDIGTTWAGKLAFSGKTREFVELTTGQKLERP